MKRATSNAMTVKALRLAATTWAVFGMCVIVRADDEPPVPKGYRSTDEVKSAIREGKIKLVNLFEPVPQDVEATTGIEYGRVGERVLELDLYQPREQASAAVPGVILIHGGGWKSGTRDVYRLYCIRLARMGYVAATISYRLSKEAPFPAAVEDVKCAVRWMRSNAEKYGVDPDRIGVLGGSAGGHLAMMAGYTADVPDLEGNGGHAGVSSRVQAVINFYGPTDLTTDFAQKAGVVIEFMGGKKYQEAPELYRQASPLTHLSRDDPPTLILHGTIDDTVPIAQADVLAKRLEQQGIPCEYERLKGWPHTMDVAEEVNRRCWWRLEGFLARHLPLPAGVQSRPASRPDGQ